MARTLVSFLAGCYALALLAFILLRLLVGDSLWWVAFVGNFMPVYFIPLFVLLPLSLIVRAKRGVLLTLPLALLGALWFGRYYLPKTLPELPGSLTLKVVSFNVWADNPNLNPIENWLKDQAADVVVTVELPQQWVNGIPALKEAYPYQITHTDWSPYWGSTLLSRHPVLETEHFVLEANGMPQQRIVIDVNGQSIAVYGIHLDLPLGPRNISIFTNNLNNLYVAMFLHYDQDQRDLEIRTLLERLRNEPLPYIVAGDFNLSDQSLIYNELAVTLGDSFREAGTGLGTSWPMFNANLSLPLLVPPLMRIDYIWHSPQFHTTRAIEGPFLGSDHLPVSAELGLQ